jgi:cellulose synthase/poly-beta-1,6-N-acetylglucosamine synthase-like glycosyltransferase
VYKNVEALSIILNALQNQSILVDEIIISEDGNSEVMKNFVATLEDEKIVHLSCPDIGWRKNTALNKAIVKASGEYLIFIDGDVVPHKRFVEGHISQAKKVVYVLENVQNWVRIYHEIF